MKILLVHLSDIHIQASTDVISNRIDAIADAVQNLDYDIEAAFVALTGDIAYHGLENEYLVAWDLVERLRLQLLQRLRDGDTEVPVHVVILPGNHDCDFTSPPVKREEALQELLEKPERASDSGLIALCTSIQKPFFSFLDAAASEGRTARAGAANKNLYYEYSFAIEGKTIVFLCCNTAWMSRIEEPQGQLLFPADAIPDRREFKDATLVITAFHHPYNWLAHENTGQFQKRVEAISDLILTGHEHRPGRRNQTGELGERNQYIEGAALQETKAPAESAFNALVLDLGGSKQKFFRFNWDGGLYHSVANEPDWEDYLGNRLRAVKRCEPTRKFKEHLDDPGIPLSRKDGSKIGLSEIYVYPELRRIPYGTDRPARTIKSDEVESYVEASHCLIITGDGQAGRTTLAKTLFKNLHAKGFVPILVHGVHQLPLDEKLFTSLDAVFKEQYGADQFEIYRQIERSRRVVLFDDFHDLQSVRAKRRTLLRQLSKYAGKVVLFANDLVLEIDELIPTPAEKGEKDVVELDHVRVQEFGHVLRDKLAERWLFATEGDSLDPSSFTYRQAEATRMINAIIGNNFVPAYPVYMLAILQATEVGATVDARASTHGYFYELFIRNALAKRRSGVEYDVLTSYLAHLAYRLFKGRQKSVEHAEFEKIHADFIAKYDIQRTAAIILKDLVNQRILEESDDSVSFKHNYLYYYFVASYLAAHLGDDEVPNAIKHLSETVYVEECANILLFLAHLSKDKYILKQFLLAAEELYKELGPANLLEDVKFLNDLPTRAHQLVYEERAHSSTKREILEQMDRDREASSGVILARDDSIDPRSKDAPPLLRLTAGLKTLQIVGQLLKNFPGSIEGEDKLNLARACYALGRRTATAALNLISDNRDAIVKDFHEILRRHHPGLPKDEMSRRVGETVIGLAHAICFGIVKRISTAVGSPELGITYKKLLAESDSPIVKLIDASISLDHTASFPDGSLKKLAKDLTDNRVAISTLQQMALQHFHLFFVEFKKKQSVCAALGIAYGVVQGREPVRKVEGDGEAPPKA